MDWNADVRPVDLLTSAWLHLLPVFLSEGLTTSAFSDARELNNDDRHSCYLPGTSGRGSWINPLRFGITIPGSVRASITASSLTMLFWNSSQATTE